MVTSRRRNDGPDRDAALRQYRRRAGVYDLELLLFEPVRRRAVQRLAPRRGDAVLDIGCGTGLSFGLLHDAVGASGRIVGVEQSPEMIGQARRRVQHEGWSNVTLVNAPAESASLEPGADAALLHFTHDVLQRDDAVANIVRHLRPGATVVACGLKWAPAWALPVNLLFVWPAALRSVTSLAGLERPWLRLQRLIGDLDVEPAFGGGVYIARGTVPN